MAKFAVHLLCYKRPDLTRFRLRELADHILPREDTRVVLINNGGPEAISDIFKIAAKAAPSKIELALIETNLGFGGGFNYGAWYADSQENNEVMILMSDDVTINADFLASHGDRIYDACMDGCLVGQRLIDWGAGWNQFREVTLPYLEGYFLALSRKTWKAVGGFDAETFHPYDYEDVDLSTSVRQLNPAINPLVPLPDLPIVHTSGMTIGFSPARTAQTVAMRARFAIKWGLINYPEKP